MSSKTARERKPIGSQADKSIILAVIGLHFADLSEV